MSEELTTVEETGVMPRLSISPRRKAAIMTIALGPQLSAEVFRHMAQEVFGE